MKKNLSFVLVLALCAALLCISAWAAGETAPTAEDTISISSAEELKSFRDDVNSDDKFEGKTVVLTNDIDLEGSEGNQWTPIGTANAPFSGIFDGGGHTISGLHVSGSSDYAGLFGVVGEGGTVKNLTVDGEVTGSDGSDNDDFTYTGGVVGENHGTVEDCSFTGTVTGGNCYTYTGGVVGQNYGAVKDCCNTGDVTGSNGGTSSHTLTGGVVGCNTGKSSIIKNCCNTGDVTVRDGGTIFTLTGGVVGSNSGGNVTNCRNSGDVTVTGNGSRTGGVVGDNGGNNTIENCYNTGDVSSTAGSTGGVAGYNDADGTVTNCYYLTGDGYPGAGIGKDEGTAGTAEGKTKEEFTSGAVANLLGDAYGQTLGVDDFPKLIALDPGAPRVYRVTFDFNDGDVTPDRVSYTNGTVTLPAEPGAAGKTFAGWRDGAGTLHEADSTVTVTADATYTAVCTHINIPDTYEIELIVSDGGEARTSLSNASAGTTITVTAAPDEGYVLAYITVDGERIDGASFVMPDHAVTVEAVFVPATTGFTDLVEGAWYVDAVNYVAVNGLMEGASATAFEPEASMTRAMVWAVLARMDGEEISGADWAEAAREWAMESGVSDGTDPDSLITREQFAAMLHRFAGEPATAANLDGYADGAAVSAWAADAMAWAIENGVITGVTDTTLSPQGTATRAQCAMMLMRFNLLELH